MHEQSIELRSALKADFPWQQQRLTFLAMALVAIITTRTVNLARLATAFTSGAQIESSYKRLQRFFRAFDVAHEQIVAFLTRHLPQEDGSWILVMDRTNWKLGRASINLLVVAVAYRQIAIPIYWRCLPQAGASNSTQRIEALTAVLKLVKRRRIAYLLADREFIGREWFRYLRSKKLDFSIRVRENLLVTGPNKQQMLARRLFAGVANGHSTILRNARLICGCRLYLSARRNERGELLIVVSPGYAHYAIEQYRTRWQIETLFGALKTRGFDMEATHMKKAERVEKLFALLTIATVWALAVGIWIDQQKPLKRKRHGRRAQSAFHRGLHWIISVLFDASRRPDDFKIALGLLSRT
jgi:hypothetical protein